jgi:hypothetical protein
MPCLLVATTASPSEFWCTWTWWKTRRAGMDAFLLLLLLPATTSGATASSTTRGRRMIAAIHRPLTSALAAATTMTTMTTMTAGGAASVKATTGSRASFAVCHALPRNGNESALYPGTAAVGTGAQSAGAVDALFIKLLLWRSRAPEGRGTRAASLRRAAPRIVPTRLFTWNVLGLPQALEAQRRPSVDVSHVRRAEASHAPTRGRSRERTPHRRQAR